MSCSKKIRFVLVLLCLATGLLRAQSSWDERAGDFVRTAAKNRYKLSVQEVKAAVDTAGVYINTFCKTCSRDVQSSLYLARANLRMYILEFEAQSSETEYTAPTDMLSKIRSDFVMAQSFCEGCKCGMIDNINRFFSDWGTQKQLDSLHQVARLMNKPEDHNYLGINLNYTPQQSIASFGLGFLNSWTVRQPKRWTDAAGRRYRKCRYEYPMAVGYFFVSYEKSLIDSKYNAVKFDPVWLNYIISAHPFQLVYADGRHGNTYIYRPEIGLSFSTFAVNYALNLPLKGTFGFLSQHNLSIRFTIPAIKLN